MGPSTRGAGGLLDSSLDWGQGLLALREWMADNQVPAVRLSHFGSAVPEAYGIEYVPPPFVPESEPWANVGCRCGTGVDRDFGDQPSGLYFQGADPFAEYRTRALTM